MSELEKLRSMPPLPHWPNRSIPYDPANSEVLKFIASEPKLLEAIFRYASYRGYIKFDRDTGTWRGVPKKPRNARKVSVESLQEALKPFGGRLNSDNLPAVLRRFGCSRSTLMLRWKELEEARSKRPKNVSSYEERKRCCECLARAGFGIKRIVRITGVPKTTAGRHLRKLGLANSSEGSKKRDAWNKANKPDLPSPVELIAEAYQRDLSVLRRLERLPLRCNEASAFQAARHYRENRSAKLAYARSYHERKKSDDGYLAKRRDHQRARRQGP